MDELSALLTSARGLNAGVARADHPSLARTLGQVESDSRALLARLPAAEQDGRATYLLARANVDAIGLARDIAGIDSATTFLPLHPLADSDVQGFLRHAHEQTLVSTIEEARRETQDEFYRVMDERSRRDWDNQKRAIFDELGGHSLALAESTTASDLRKSVRALAPSRHMPAFSPAPVLHAKMRVYSRVLAELNTARLRDTSFPLLNALLAASREVAPDETSQTSELFQFLSKIVDETPFVPSAEQGSVHSLNAPTFERKYSRAYLGDPGSREAIAFRTQLVRGSKQALEEQYNDVIDRCLLSNPIQAQLGGDPSYVNRVRAFVTLQYYKSGRWDDRIELVRGQPEWAKLFFLIRTGHPNEALRHVQNIDATLTQKDAGFTAFFRAWVDSGCKRLPSKLRDRLQTAFNSHVLHASATDPFKLALYKLMGRLDPSKRNLPYVTSTTEDWMWFQLSMVDEDEGTKAGLKTLGEALISYGETHFEGPTGQTNSRKGVWPRVLLLCGLFENAVAALSQTPEFQVEAVHLAIALAYYGLLRVPSRSEASEVEILTQTHNSGPTINIGLMISRYIRNFIRSDPVEAAQYAYAICLSENQDSQVGKEQVEYAWELIRRIIATAEHGHSWEQLIGSFTADGNRISGTIERDLPLLKIKSTQQYNDLILLRTAAHSEREGRLNEAIRLYNLAGAHSTVMTCLARGLGDCVAEPTGGDEGKVLRRTARDILRHYDRVNKVTGRERDTVIQLLGVLDATDAKAQGHLETALETLESTEIVPLDGDAAAIATRAADIREQDDAISRNLHIILPLIMDVLDGLHQRIKNGVFSQSSKQTALKSVRRKARALMIFAGTLRYRLSPEVHSYLTRVDVAIAL